MQVGFFTKIGPSATLNSWCNVSRGFAKVRASSALFTRKTGPAFCLLSFRPDSCLPLLELLKMSGNLLSLCEKEMVMSCVEFFFWEREGILKKKINGNDGIPFTTDMLKTELYSLVEKKKPHSKHKVNEMVSQQDFHVLCLPVGQCELNSTELIWV